MASCRLRARMASDEAASSRGTLWPTKRKHTAELLSNNAASEKRPRHNYQDMITVSVENDNGKKKDFAAHRALVCNQSPYFESACSGRWAEGQDGVVPLTRIDHRVFETVLHWLYSGDLDHLNLAYKDQDGNPKPHHIPVHRMCKLWDLAKYLQIPDLPDKIIDRTRDLYRDDRLEFSCFEGMETIFKLTNEDSTFRRLFITMISQHDGKWLEEHMHRLPMDLVKSFAVGYVSGKKRVNPGMDEDSMWDDPCVYHDHDGRE